MHYCQRDPECEPSGNPNSLKDKDGIMDLRSRRGRERVENERERVHTSEVPKDMTLDKAARGFVIVQDRLFTSTLHQPNLRGEGNRLR